MKKVVGIDIAKLTFEASFLTSDHHRDGGSYSNDPKGFSSLLSQTGSGYVFVMEATGPYYYALASFLYENGCQVSVINPMVSRRYCQMRMQRSKTDKADANALREYGESQPLDLWKPTGEQDMRIKNRYSNLKRLIRNRTSLSNQLDSLRATGELDKELEQEMIKELEDTKQRVEQAEKTLDQLIKDHYPNLYRNLMSIPGIGMKSATLLLVACRGFNGFDNYKQVVAYIGTSPKLFQSGTSVKGKSHICKLGMAAVRATLFMAAKSARRYNPSCKALYERLRANGKPYRVAMVAVINKLVKQAFAIAKSGIDFRADYTPILN